MKKVIFCLVALILLAIPLSLACKTSPEPAQPTTPTTPSTPTTPEKPEVIELVVNDHNPPQSTVAAAWKEWETWVNDQSDELKVTVVSGGALLTGDEAYRGTQTGVCDIAHYVVDREEGFLLNLIMALPFLGWSEQHVEDKYMTLLNEFPEMEKEWEGITILGVMMMPPTHLHHTSKVIKTPDDLRGSKMMGAEAMTIEAVRVAGGTAVELGIMDMTPSLQTGVIDGVINHFPVCGIFGALELLKYHTIFGGGGINMTPMYAIMNTEKLNSLPQNLQKILIDSGQVWFEKQKALDIQSMEQAMAMCEGHTFTELTPQEIEVWYNTVKSDIHDSWIEECEASGLPGQKVYDRALQLVAK